MTSSYRMARTLGLVLGIGLVLTASPIRAEDAPAPGPRPAPAPGGAVPPGLRVGREQMWPAPTAEDWKKPCLVTWQRSWEDAQAVSRETGRPILICINMDGEIASEHYAGVRYRQPEIAALYEPYVCVIASVYRHTPRDYDDEGRRIPCPRFGGVTCAEHIAMEAAIYEKYEKGQRVSPRHIGVELDGSEMYDVFYRNDTASVFEDIRKGIANRKAPPPPVVRGDRPIADRVESRAREDRDAVEAAYREGDRDRRRVLLDAAAARPAAAPIDLLRLAVFGLDADLARQARAALAKVEDPAAAELIGDALRAPMDAPEREALLGALEKMGATSPRARWISVVHRGLSTTSGAVDAKTWLAARDGSGAPPPPSIDWSSLESEIQKRDAAAKANPADVASRLDLAESALVVALAAPKTYTSDPRAARSFAKRMFDASRSAALEAEALGAKGWRVNAALALATYYQGQAADAYPRAEAAVKDLPPGAVDWSSMAVLQIFAEARWKAIQKAVRQNAKWPPEWLADVHAAHAVLLRHPLGTDDQVAWHYDFLAWLGARDQAARVLEAGLVRFRLSPALHERLRERTLVTKGPDGLEAAYDALLAEKDAPVGLDAFAGRASVVAADQHRRVRAYDAALASYGRAIARYEQAAAVAGANREPLDGAIAFALAGRARVAYQLGDDERALADVVASFARRKDLAGTVDGLGITPLETAQMLLDRLKTAKRDDLAAKLEAAIATLDPELVKPEKN